MKRYWLLCFIHKHIDSMPDSQSFFATPEEAIAAAKAEYANDESRFLRLVVFDSEIEEDIWDSQFEETI